MIRCGVQGPRSHERGCSRHDHEGLVILIILIQNIIEVVVIRDRGFGCFDLIRSQNRRGFTGAAKNRSALGASGL